MNNINYEEELILILENNKLKTLPSQELIDSNERVVKAIWKNFVVEKDEDEQFSFREWYTEANWGKILHKYQINVSLWEELLESKFYQSYFPTSDTSYDFILSETFRNDFPIIADHFLNNNDKLIELFNKTHNKFFYQRLALDRDKKEDVYKLFLIKYAKNIDKDIIAQYENDDEFVKKLLEKKPSYFRELNKGNRNNDTYIKMALIDMSNYFVLSEEKKDLFFKPWIKHYVKHVKLKMLDHFTSEQQAYILSKRKDLLASALNSGHKNHHFIAASCLLNDVEAYIDAFSEEAIANFAKNRDNLKKVSPQLEKFVEEYSDTGTSKKDNKLIFLARYIPELKENLQENIFYKLNKLFEAKEKLGVDWFENISKQAIDLYEDNKIDRNSAEAFINKARNCLTIDALKELRIPKANAFDHVRINILNKKLQESLPVQDGTTRKLKI